MAYLKICRVELMVLVACSLLQTTFASRTAQFIGPWQPTSHVNARTTSSIAFHPSNTTSTNSVPCGIDLTHLHIPTGSLISDAFECRPTSLSTGFIAGGTERSTSNVTVAPSSPTSRAGPDNPNPDDQPDPPQSGESRSLSIIFFAISALLTLATIVVAIVYGAGAARATKRLLHALTTIMRESPRAIDVEMGNLHSPSPSANAGQTPEYSPISSAAPM